MVENAPDATYPLWLMTSNTVDTMYKGDIKPELAVLKKTYKRINVDLVYL